MFSEEARSSLYLLFWAFRRFTLFGKLSGVCFYRRGSYFPSLISIDQWFQFGIVSRGCDERVSKELVGTGSLQIISINNSLKNVILIHCSAFSSSISPQSLGKREKTPLATAAERLLGLKIEPSWDEYSHEAEDMSPFRTRRFRETKCQP